MAVAAASVVRGMLNDGTLAVSRQRCGVEATQFDGSRQVFLIGKRGNRRYEPGSARTFSRKVEICRENT